MFSIRQLCAVAIALVLAVPAHAGIWAATIPPDKLAGIHRIAVISALGDQAQIKKIGQIAFANKTNFLLIGDWGLDDVAVRAATSALSGRFEVETVAYDRASFLPNNGFFAPSPDRVLQTLVLGLPKSDIDAYLVIQKATRGLQYPSNQRITGLGAGEGPGLAWPNKVSYTPPVVFAEYWVTLVRATDGKAIGWRWSHVRDGNKKMVDATAPEDPSDWADTAEQMTDMQKANLRKALGDLLGQSIGDTLRQLGLTG